MLKRFLPLLLVLTLSVFPALACVHTDSGEVVDEDLLEANLISAQPGVAGSVDLICPLCHEVIEHIVFDPLPAEAEHPASSDAEITPVSVPVGQQETVQEQTSQQGSSAQPEEPSQPAEPAQSEVPVQSVTTAEPAQPAQPEVLVQSVTTAEPAQPAQPEVPVQSVTTAEPAQPAQPEVPVQPAQPAEPAQSEVPVQSVMTAESAQPEAPASRSDGSAAVPAADTGSNSPVASPAAEPPKAQEVTVNVPPETVSAAGGGGKATGSSGGGAARQGGRAKISGGGEEAAVPAEKPQTFPFRRMKMKPKPGIRAEAAGELLWPVFGTPFQNIYND